MIELTYEQIDDVAYRIDDAKVIETKHDVVRDVLEAAIEAGWRPPESQ